MTRTLNDVIKGLPQDQQMEIETQAARLIEDEMMLQDPRIAHIGDCAMEKELYEILAAQGIRIFSLEVGTFKMLYIHPKKTTQAWRSDVRGIIDEINTLNETTGCSEDAVYNELIRRMADTGYLEVTDVAADTYEGRVVVHSASIKDDPEHKEQTDGFGHHGWESGIDESATTDEPHQRERREVGKGSFPKDFWKKNDRPVDKDGYCLAALLEEREKGR